MSSTMPISTGAVRRKRNMPAGLRVSPTLIFTPYFSQMYRSFLNTSSGCAISILTTPSAPSMTSVRSVVAISFAG